MTFTVDFLPGKFAICHLAPDAAIPDWAQGEFVSITRTQDELSMVCRQEEVPGDLLAERGWRCFRIAGKLDFSLVGVIAALTKLLADASISVFVMSTFATDYFLVRQLDMDRTVNALKEAGYSVHCR